MIPVARFIRAYGPATWDNGEIAWPWFWALFAEIDRQDAMRDARLIEVAKFLAICSAGAEPNTEAAELRDSIEREIRGRAAWFTPVATREVSAQTAEAAQRKMLRLFPTA